MEGPAYEPQRAKTDVMNLRPRFHGNKYIDALPDVDQQLENAIIMGDLSWVKDCIKKGANPNVRLDEKGTTPLMFAIQGGWASIVRYLVESTDVDISLTDSGGFNATDLAAYNGFYSAEERGQHSDICDIVTYLKDRGLEYSWRGALIGGDVDRINEFLENGQDLEERIGYYTEGNYQMTGLQLAVKFGRYAIARYLMCLGAAIPRDICQMQVPFEHEVKAYS